MLKDIVEVKPTLGYRLQIRFEDGVEGEIDISKLIQLTGVFEALKLDSYFRQVFVDPDLGTICWPNGADLDPDVLYGEITGQPILEFEVA